MKKRWTGWRAIRIAPSVADLERFHILYQRVSADLGKVATLESEGELRRYLEWLVGRAYAEIHETRERTQIPAVALVPVEFPRAFRRHIRAFQLAVALTIAGAAFGAMALRHRCRSEIRHHAV